MDSIALSTPTPDASSGGPDNPSFATEGSNPQEHHYLMKRFDVDVENPRASEAFAKVWAWAKERAEAKDDRDAIVTEAMRLYRRLGVPGSGVKPWALMENYVNTWNTARQAEKRLRELEGDVTI